MLQQGMCVACCHASSAHGQNRSIMTEPHNITWADKQRHELRALALRNLSHGAARGCDAARPGLVRHASVLLRVHLDVGEEQQLVPPLSPAHRCSSHPGSHVIVWASALSGFSADDTVVRLTASSEGSAGRAAEGKRSRTGLPCAPYVSSMMCVSLRS